MNGVVQDLRFALRQIWRKPGFTLIAIVSLALGIGANTAIFTLIDKLILKSLPVRQPEQLSSFGDGSDAGQLDGIGPGPLDIFPFDFYKQVEQQHDPFQNVCANGSFPIRVSVEAARRGPQGRGWLRPSPALSLKHLGSNLRLADPSFLLMPMPRA